MTKHRAVYLVTDYLEMAGWYVSREDKRIAPFNIIATQSNRVMYLFVRDLADENSSARCLSRSVIDTIESHAESMTKSYIMFLTEKGYYIKIVDEDVDMDELANLKKVDLFNTGIGATLLDDALKSICASVFKTYDNLLI